MERKVLMVVLALGAVAGFGSSLRHCHQHALDRRAGSAFEEHLADVCVQAAERSRAQEKTR